MATDIVIDNLLCFLSNKIDTMTTDVLVRLCVTTYDEDEIRKSRDTLYELCESAGRMVKRQGPKMKEQTIEDVIKIMHEKGHEMPKFAAHDLSRLPPVSFDSIDVSALLHRMERTATEVHLLKDALSQQVKVNEDLHSAISSMQIRLDDLERGSMITETVTMQVAFFVLMLHRLRIQTSPWQRLSLIQQQQLRLMNLQSLIRIPSH